MFVVFSHRQRYNHYIGTLVLESVLFQRSTATTAFGKRRTVNHFLRKLKPFPAGIPSDGHKSQRPLLLNGHGVVKHLPHRWIFGRSACGPLLAKIVFNGILVKVSAEEKAVF